MQNVNNKGLFFSIIVMAILFFGLLCIAALGTDINGGYFSLGAVSKTNIISPEKLKQEAIINDSILKPNTKISKNASEANFVNSTCKDVSMAWIYDYKNNCHSDNTLNSPACTVSDICSDFTNTATGTKYALSYNHNPVSAYSYDGQISYNSGCNYLNTKCLVEGGNILLRAKCDFQKQAPVYAQDPCSLGQICVKGECISTGCGNGFKEENEDCDDGNNNENDNCSNDCKLLDNFKPDLYVGQIYHEVISEDCVNTFYFNICNKGDGKLVSDFDVSVLANQKILVVPYLVSIFGAIDSGACVSFNSAMLNIFAFGIGLDENVMVNINLDFNNVILEEKENNNSKSGEIFSGDGYYNNGQKCSKTCYDSDSSIVGYEPNSALLFGTIYLANLFENSLFNSNDFCDEFGLILTEQTCLTSGLSDKKNLACYLFYPPKKCENMACADLNSEESQSYLACDQNEGNNSPLSFSSINFTYYDNKITQYASYCADDRYLSKYSCKNNFIPQKDEYDCLNNYNGLCLEGRCVPGELQTNCEESTIDYFHNGYVDLQYLIVTSPVTKTISDTRSDICNGEQILMEARCDSNNLTGYTYLDYNCAQDGASCYNGACVYPDESLKDCNFYGSVLIGTGYDPFTYKFGYSINAFGVYNGFKDVCQNNTLIETMCTGNNLSFSPVDCKEYGENYICKQGACIESDENNISCEYLFSDILYTDALGNQTTYDINSCLNDSTLISRSCGYNADNKPVVVENNIFCNGGQKCDSGACITPYQEFCEDDDGLDYFNKGSISWAGIGDTYLSGEFDFCSNNQSLTERTCNGNVPDYETIDCNSFGDKYVCSSGKCLEETGPYCEEQGNTLTYESYYVLYPKYDICDGMSFAGYIATSYSSILRDYFCTNSLDSAFDLEYVLCDGICGFKFANQDGNLIFLGSECILQSQLPNSDYYYYPIAITSLTAYLQYVAENGEISLEDYLIQEVYPGMAYWFNKDLAGEVNVCIMPLLSNGVELSELKTAILNTKPDYIDVCNLPGD